MNVSSIVVQTRPEHCDALRQILEDGDLCEVHFHDEKGRIIVTIEAQSVSDEIANLTKIQALPNVIAADMSYSYSEDELDKAREDIELSSGSIADVLQDDEIDASNIVYRGDLKKKGF